MRPRTTITPRTATTTIAITPLTATLTRTATTTAITPITATLTRTATTARTNVQSIRSLQFRCSHKRLM